MGRRQQSRRVVRKSILRMRRKPHGLRVERGRTLENERMDLGTTTVLIGVSLVLSSIVQHCGVMGWLLHMSTLKLPWLDFSGKKFWREIRLLGVRAQIHSHGKREDSMIFCYYSVVMIIYEQDMCFAISFLSQYLLALKVSRLTFSWACISYLQCHGHLCSCP